ncbi:hypothetical protein TNCV_3019861 [Trichonephila clavipes]|nr:hypothetical protein TNCV_3019861 [Trichonephila clavipes]
MRNTFCTRKNGSTRLKMGIISVSTQLKDPLTTANTTRKLELQSDEKVDTRNKTFTNDTTTYRFTRIPFGLACSLFLLSAATRELASEQMQDFPTAALNVEQKSLYA